jgi:hypothetical protein
MAADQASEIFFLHHYYFEQIVDKVKIYFNLPAKVQRCLPVQVKALLRPRQFRPAANIPSMPAKK